MSNKLVTYTMNIFALRIVCKIIISLSFVPFTYCNIMCYQCNENTCENNLSSAKNCVDNHTLCYEGFTTAANSSLKFNRGCGMCPQNQMDNCVTCKSNLCNKNPLKITNETTSDKTTKTHIITTSDVNATTDTIQVFHLSAVPKVPIECYECNAESCKKSASKDWRRCNATDKCFWGREVKQHLPVRGCDTCPDDLLNCRYCNKTSLCNVGGKTTSIASAAVDPEIKALDYFKCYVCKGTTCVGLEYHQMQQCDTYYQCYTEMGTATGDSNRGCDNCTKKKGYSCKTCQYHLCNAVDKVPVEDVYAAVRLYSTTSSARVRLFRERSFRLLLATITVSVFSFNSINV